MKYFTREWCHGNVSEEESDRIVESYWSHIDRISERLPDKLVVLAKEVSLHDGLIRRIYLDSSSKHLELDLVCGDLQVGYFDLELKYEGLEIEDYFPTLLDAIFKHTKIEVCHDEVDIDNSNRIVHRTIFYPEYEIELVTDSLTYSKVPREEREVAPGDRCLLIS